MQQQNIDNNNARVNILFLLFKTKLKTKLFSFSWNYELKIDASKHDWWQQKKAISIYQKSNKKITSHLIKVKIELQGTLDN